MSSLTERVSGVETDVACIQCAYNLRGQTLHRASTGTGWRATCPECGTEQEVRANATAVPLQPWFILACVCIATFVLWYLASWIAYAEATLTRGHDLRMLQQTFTATRRGGTPAMGFDSLGNFAGTVGINSVILLLPAIAIGSVFSLAPYATGLQRQLASALIIVIACSAGAWMGLSGEVAASGDPALMRLLLTGSAAGGIEPQWQWQLAGGVIGLLLAFLGARIGLAIGPRVVSGLVSMFVPHYLLPSWLARKPR